MTYPWAPGDALLAVDLNAAIANVTSSSARAVIHVQDHGQIGTGNAAIDTATMLAAIAALPENGGVLDISSSDIDGINLNQTITLTKSCKIMGATANGWCSTIVCQMSGPAFVFSDPTPSLQKTFEVENVRFVGNNPTGPTRSAIQVTVGVSGSQVFPSFVGNNITISANVSSAASPYARTFTRGIEFVPIGTPTGSQHCFWNVVLENVAFLGVVDSGTGQPIAGTSGVMFGQLVYGSFHNVHVSLAASGFRQTDYCEGITAISCQLFTVTNGWDMASFPPVGAAAVKLLQPVMLGCMINAIQSSLALDCVDIGQFSNCYLTGAGAANVAMTNAQGTQICNNAIVNGTIGVSMTRAGFNEGGNIIACNTLSNQTTNISLGASTFDSVLDNQQANGAAIVLANAGGTGNVIRRVIATPAVTGTKGGNAALASLLTALAAYGLVTDSTT